MVPDRGTDAIRGRRAVRASLLGAQPPSHTAASRRIIRRHVCRRFAAWASIACLGLSRDIVLAFVDFAARTSQSRPAIIVDASLCRVV